MSHLKTDAFRICKWLSPEVQTTGSEVFAELHYADNRLLTRPALENIYPNGR